MSKNCEFEESSIYDYEALKGFMAVGPLEKGEKASWKVALLASMI